MPPTPAGLRRLAAPVLLLLAAALGACGARETAEQGSASAVAADTTQPPLVAGAAADVLARARDGGADATIVNVWATWCGPCREEFPAMLATAERHAGRVRLLLMSADFEDQASEARAFLRSQGIRDTSWLKHENDQVFIDAIHPKWSGALPATLVFDRQGRLRAFWEGGADSARFEAAVQQALSPDGGSS